MLLDYCCKIGIWIVVDEVYECLYYVDGVKVVLSFLDLMEFEDCVVVIYSFLKSFLMIGWWLGWMVLLLVLLDSVVKLIEFNIFCVLVFV